MNESKPKILPPSMRSSKRYIVFKIISDEKISFADFGKAIWNSMLSYLGELKSAEAKIWIIQNLYNEEKQRGVIKCDHNSVEEVRTVLSLIQFVGESKVIFNVIGVTGTIKSAASKYFSE
jgi:ribonuclease P/MRP protein subunit POP5